MALAIARHTVALSKEGAALATRVVLGGSVPPGAREKFQRECAHALQVERVFAVGSGRTALALALRGLNLPVGASIALPSYCFFSVVGVVEGLGLKPIFVPVDADRMSLCPQALEHVLTEVSCVVVIHPFGQTAHIDELTELCAKHGVPLVEDGSQSTGAVAGKPIGAHGAAGVFSLVSGKNLQTFGGGILATSDPELADHVAQQLTTSTPVQAAVVRQAFRSGLSRWSLTGRRSFGLLTGPALGALQRLAPGRLAAVASETRVPFDTKRPISLLSDEQAAIGLIELGHLQARNRRRCENALQLVQRLRDLPGIRPQGFDPAHTNTFNALPVRVAAATALAAALRRRGIDTRADYMEWYGPRAFEEQVLYLPNHPDLRPADIDRIAEAVEATLRA